MSVSIGRGSDNDIVLDSGSVSGRHAEMRRVEGGYELVDRGSTNGIKYNGSRMEGLALQSGMEVKLGDVSFCFDLTEAELETLQAEVPYEEPPVVKEPALPRPPPPRRQAPPPSRQRPPSRQSRQVAQESAGMGFGSIVLFLLFTAAAFFGGLYIRHEKETGVSLIHAMGNKGKVEKAIPVETAPVGSEGE
eukprot:g3823.t1